MAIRCQSGIRLFRPNAIPGQEAIIDIDDLQITEDAGNGMFFSSSQISSGSDANETTFFPTSQVSGGFRNAGSVTNDGNEIRYTFANDMEPGDCITIEYTATNGLGQQDSDCTQSFDICVRAPGTNTGGEPGCRDGGTFNTNPLNGSILADALATDGSTGNQFTSTFITDASGTPVTGTSILDGGTRLVFPAGLSGPHTLRYQIGQQGGAESVDCEVTINVITPGTPTPPTGTGGEIDCVEPGTIYPTFLSGEFQAIQLAANGIGLNPFFISFFVTDEFGTAVSGITLSEDREIITFPASVPTGVYNLQYQLGRPDGGTTITCNTLVRVTGTTPDPTPEQSLACLANGLLFSETSLRLLVTRFSGVPGVTFDFMNVFDANDQLVQSFDLAGQTVVNLPGNLPNGADYRLRYGLIAPNGETITCDTTFRYDNVGLGSSNELSCSQTRWLDGTPELRCGGAASEHRAQLITSNGGPLTSSAAALSFITTGMPTGVSVTVARADTNTGIYTFLIDPSAATCAGTVNASIGV